MERIFKEAYDKVWKEKAGTSPLRVVSGEKVYETEGNFFLCGFSGIRFLVKGKNKVLLNLLENEGIDVRNDYPTGKRFSFKYGNQGNGDHQIQVEAYRKVAEVLNNLGYDVGVYDILD